MDKMRQRNHRSKMLLFVAAVFLTAAIAGAQVETVDQIVYPPLPEVELPQPERHVLDNGLVVFMVEDRELPLVTVRALIRTGSRYESADKVGLAGLTGQVLRSGGTQKTPSDALDDYLEDKAASIETSVGTATGSAVMSCLSEDFPELLGVFEEVLRYPAFEEDKLAVAKNQVVTGIARQNDDAGDILGREYRQLIYDEASPYARDTTYATIGAVTREDLVAWHARYYQPNRMILGLVGDFDKKEALALVAKTFGAWPVGEPFTDPAVEPGEMAEPGIYFIEKNDINQSYIRIGHRGILRNNPDYYAVEVLNQVFGGSFASRLFNNVRSKKGLAYNVFGYVSSRWDYPGVFFMSMSTKTETTAEGVDALLEEAGKLKTEPPSEEEVEKAKTSILASFVFNSDSTAEILGQQLAFEYYGYPLDWLERYRRGVEAVTVADVEAAAAKYVRPEEFVMLVVGPGEGQDRPLSDFGEVRTIDITIPEPPAEKVEVTEDGKRRGGELIAKAVEAIGGADRLDRLESLDSKAILSLTTPQGEMQAGIRTWLVFPDRLRIEIELPFGTMVQVLNGAGSFVQPPQQQPVPMPENTRLDLAQAFNRQLPVLLRQRDAEGFVAVAAGTEEVGGTVVENVHVELDGESVTLGVDPESGRVLVISYRGKNMMGAPGKIRQVSSDFRDVDGLSLSFNSEATFDGEPMQRAELESITVDGAIDDALFEMPE